MWIIFGIIYLFLPSFYTFRCYSCANDFVVWNWRHFFLKRNYGISSSDNLCAHYDYDPSLSNECLSSCFVFYLNGTDKETGLVTNLGIGRGCSAQFLSDEQYNQRALGVYTKPSMVSQYLSHDFDKYDIHEFWCFCAGSRCNTDECFSHWTSHQSYHHGYYRTGGRRASQPFWNDPYHSGYYNNSSTFFKNISLSILFIVVLIFFNT
uniref:Caenorhabditis elegans ly-6-related family-containing protein n=1 Tax=Panagrolaimus sp. JU765 TaxID=591449 RepID=A0AC34RLY9_9BILA